MHRIAAATAVAVGNEHPCAIADGGRVFCWGRNNMGQVGDGSRDNAGLPVPVRLAPSWPRDGTGLRTGRRGSLAAAYGCHQLPVTINMPSRLVVSAAWFAVGAAAITFQMASSQAWLPASKAATAPKAAT